MQLANKVIMARAGDSERRARLAGMMRRADLGLIGLVDPVLMVTNFVNDYAYSVDM